MSFPASISFMKNNLARFGLIFCAALPWVYPFAPPPSNSGFSWILASYCLAGLLGIAVFFKLNRLQVSHGIAVGWLIAGLANALIVFIQYFGIQIPHLPYDLHVWIIPGEPGHPFGHLRQRNHEATFLGMALLALIYWAHAQSQTFKSQRTLNALTCLAACLLAAACAATGSRLGLVDTFLIVAALAYFSIDRIWQRPILFGTLSGYALGSFLFPWLLSQSHPELQLAGASAIARIAEVHPCDNRFILYRNIAELISQQPWTGWGWDRLSYAHYSTIYTWGPADMPAERLCSMLDNAHNLILQIAVELGLPAALAFTGGFVWWVGVHHKPWRERDPQKLLFWGTLGFIMLHSMLEYPLWYGHFFMAMLLCVWRVSVTNTPAAMPPEKSKPIAALAFLAMALTLLANYAQFDYNRVEQLYKPSFARSSWYVDDPFGHAESSWFFERFVLYAQITRQPVDAENAPVVFERSLRLIHRICDFRVVSKLIDSAELLGKKDVVQYHTLHFKDAYPDKYIVWQKERQEAATKAAASAASQVQAK
jgi:O-antigen ligase